MWNQVILNFMFKLRLNPKAWMEHLTSQLSWAAAWLLVTHVCPAYLVDELRSLCSVAPYDWVDGGSVDYFWMVSMLLLLWGVDAILRNGCGIYGQNYGVLLQGSEMTASFSEFKLVCGTLDSGLETTLRTYCFFMFWTWVWEALKKIVSKVEKSLSVNICVFESCFVVLLSY